MKLSHKRIAAILVLLAGLALFLLRNGGEAEYTFIPIEAPEGLDTIPVALNDLCQVVGRIRGRKRPETVFFWDSRTGMKDLGNLGGKRVGINDLNDLGQFVGWIATNTGEQHAFISSVTAGLADLGTLGGRRSQAEVINNLGQVAGLSQTASGEEHVFLWEATSGMRDLGTLGTGASHVGLAAMNNRGQLAGGWIEPITPGWRQPQPPFLFQRPLPPVTKGGKQSSAPSSRPPVPLISSSQMGFSSSAGPIAYPWQNYVIGSRRYGIQHMFLWDPELGRIGIGDSTSIQVPRTARFLGLGDDGTLLGLFERRLSHDSSFFSWNQKEGLKEHEKRKLDALVQSANTRGEAIGQYCWKRNEFVNQSRSLGALYYRFDLERFSPLGLNPQRSDCFVYHGREMIDLRTSSNPFPGWGNMEVIAINEKGQILGTLEPDQGPTRAFLLSPKGMSGTKKQ